jgi:hypothetical protein
MHLSKMINNPGKLCEIQGRTRSRDSSHYSCADGSLWGWSNYNRVIVLILLFIPFRRGERWVNWTIFLGGIGYSVLCFIVTFKVYLATNASTPWPDWLISMVLYLLGFLLSLGIEKEK